jgi:hypothetical protein
MGSLVVHAPRRRPTQREKERVVRRLQDACVDERLSPDTFARRLDLAFSARTRFELDRLLADIGEPSRPVLLAMRAVNALSARHGPARSRVAGAANAAARAAGDRRYEDDRPGARQRLRRRGRERLPASRDGRARRRRHVATVRCRLPQRHAPQRVARTAPIDARPGDELELGDCRFILDRAR